MCSSGKSPRSLLVAQVTTGSSGRRYLCVPHAPWNQGLSIRLPSRTESLTPGRPLSQGLVVPVPARRHWGSGPWLCSSEHWETGFSVERGTGDVETNWTYFSFGWVLLTWIAQAD